MLLKDLRDSNDTIAAKTSEQYARFISRLEMDISTKSKETIGDVMRKVKLGEVTTDDIDSLKKVMAKL